MEKTLYWLIQSNGDLSVTVQNLEQAKQLIEGDFDGVSEQDAGEFEYTLTPTYLTQEQYENLPEAN